jgi:hypothetical protein
MKTQDLETPVVPRIHAQGFTVTLANGCLGVGRDFVSAATGPHICHGTAEIGGRSYPFKSSINQDLTHRALRLSAEQAGKRLTNISSQAL